jgi:urate oxidase
MPARLGDNHYGKRDVRVVKVTRGLDRHELRDLTVDVALEGEFDAAHVDGDNTGLLATDTMRNTVYAVAQQHPVDSLEAFGMALVERFLAAGPSVRRATVRVAERSWARIAEHPHAFQRGAGGTRVANVEGTADSARVTAGLEDLLVLKTTESGWEGFEREEYTTLPETADRIMATVVTADWDYTSGELDFNAAWTAARDALLRAFGDHYSPSVQFTLYRMGEAVLEACPAIERVRLSLPNRHHLLFDLARFGLANDNEIFQATTEPYGLIEGTVERHP